MSLRSETVCAIYKNKRSHTNFQSVGHFKENDGVVESRESSICWGLLEMKSRKELKANWGGQLWAPLGVKKRLQEQWGDRKGRKRAALACLEARLTRVFCWPSKVVEGALVFELEG